jgi:hypothetical protein
MTLHRHKVDDYTVVSDGQESVQVPAGWKIADNKHWDDIRVIADHPWQSTHLFFAEEEENLYETARYSGTAACHRPCDTGELRLRKIKILPDS